MGLSFIVTERFSNVKAVDLWTRRNGEFLVRVIPY